MRACNICNISLPSGSFYPSVATRCKNCHRARMKELRLTDPEVQRRERERAKLPHRKARQRVITVAWRDKNPVAYKAQTAVGNALRTGKLKKSPCVLCGITSNVHGHHKDYTQPLNVTWLCAKCHHRLHASFPELGGHGVHK